MMNFQNRAEQPVARGQRLQVKDEGSIKDVRVTSVKWVDLGDQGYVVRVTDGVTSWRISEYDVVN